MNRKDELKNILDSFGVYSLIQVLKLDYDSLIKRQDYEDKITPHGLDVLSQNLEVKNHILPMVFPLEANGLMQSHELFIANGIKAYEKLLIVLEEEKIVIEKSFHFNTNYFMKLGISEEKVIKGLEKFADLICNTEEINYLVKNKVKKLSVTLRSENESKIKKLYSEIKNNSHLIQEFVQGFDDSQEYQKRFKTYWYLNGQFTVI